MASNEQAAQDIANSVLAMAEKLDTITVQRLIIQAGEILLRRPETQRLGMMLFAVAAWVFPVEGQEVRAEMPTQMRLFLSDGDVERLLVALRSGETAGMIELLEREQRETGEMRDAIANGDVEAVEKLVGTVRAGHNRVVGMNYLSHKRREAREGLSGKATNA